LIIIRLEFLNYKTTPKNGKKITRAQQSHDGVLRAWNFPVFSLFRKGLFAALLFLFLAPVYAAVFEYGVVIVTLNRNLARSKIEKTAFSNPRQSGESLC